MAKERAKAKAGKMLTKHGMTTGSVVLGPFIRIHDYNASEYTAIFTWEGELLTSHPTEPLLIGRSRKRRTFHISRRLRCFFGGEIPEALRE